MKKLLLFFLLIISSLVIAPASHAQVQPRGFDYDNKPLTLTVDDKTFTVDADTVTGWQGLNAWPKFSPLQESPNSLPLQIGSWLGLPSSPEPQAFQIYHFSPDKIYSYLQTTIASTTNQTMVEPELIIENGRVTKFTPPQTGLSLNVYASTFNVLNALEARQTKAELAVNEVRPTKNLADTNNLGITELVAQGVSGFAGSPNNRRHNIAVGVEKMKGIIVPQGGTFSFNDNLGDVDGEHGFLPELVIKKTGTVPEFGGGLCQVSSTTFRAAMAAGLPITERRNHAYAVQYYAPQGTDATIYPGIVDLKFTNNTPAAILIWPYLKDKNTLIFDFYGTKDSRQVTLEKPVVYDRQTDGSMKATWTREVTNNGQTKTDVFKSVYQSPALYHKTESFVSATGTPSSGLQIPKTN